MGKKKAKDVFRTHELGIETSMDILRVGGSKTPLRIRRVAGKNPYLVIPNTVVPAKTGKIMEMPITAFSSLRSKTKLGKNFRVYGLISDRKRIVVKIPRTAKDKEDYFTKEGLKMDIIHYNEISRATNVARYKGTEWLRDFRFVEIPPETEEEKKTPRLVELPLDSDGMRLDYFEMKGMKNLAEHTFNNPEHVREAIMKIAEDATTFFEHLDMVLDIKAENYSNYMPKNGVPFPLIDMDSFSNRPRGTLRGSRDRVLTSEEEAMFVGGRLGMTLVDIANTNFHLLKPNERLLRNIKKELVTHIKKTIKRKSERRAMMDAVSDGIEWGLHQIRQNGYNREADRITKSLGI